MTKGDQFGCLSIENFNIRKEKREREKKQNEINGEDRGARVRNYDNKIRWKSSVKIQTKEDGYIYIYIYTYLAAIIPASFAVAKIGPFGPISSSDDDAERICITSGGNNTLV